MWQKRRWTAPYGRGSCRRPLGRAVQRSGFHTVTSGDFYDRAVARILRMTIAAGLLGTAITVEKFGFRNGAGFAVGALLSLFSFHTIRGVAYSLGADSNRRAAAFAALFLMRYALIGGAIYVIVKYLEVSPMALLAGLFASIAAVLAEVLYELAFSK